MSVHLCTWRMATRISKTPVKLDNYFMPKVNVIHERVRFYQRVQKQGESVEELIRSLHELAETCAFGEAKSKNIRDRLVIGVLDKELSQLLTNDV